MAFNFLKNWQHWRSSGGWSYPSPLPATKGTADNKICEAELQS
ncbi:hypothetical protein [Nostoc sp. FACHB-87]|nr:hypothetical protein [Nostoc sp. FACHB-87]